MQGRGAREAGWARQAVVIVAAMALGLLARQAFGVEPPPGKMERQIEVMEKILDQVLIDSPNFLVSGRGNARGLWVSEFGIIMTFDAALLDKDRNWNFDFGKGFRVEKDDKGRQLIIIEEDGDATEEEIQEALEKSEAKKSQRESTQDRLYKRGKAEIVETLLDYGDTISALPAGKWLAIVAFLKDTRYFDERGLSRLVLKAKIDDLRAYTAGKINEQQMVKRIVEEEY